MARSASSSTRRIRDPSGRTSEPSSSDSNTKLFSRSAK
jgi:hypothetical protein